MKRYDKEVFEKLILLIRNDDKESEQWLMENHRELKEFWDAYEGVEKSFKWLLENGYKQLAATIDAMDGDDKAKVFLLSSGNRELAAFVEASAGSQSAVSFLLKTNHPEWVRVAKAIFDKEKKKGKSFWSIFSLGNPFR